MAKTFVRVKGWEEVDDNKIKVVYNTWDGKCTCTSQLHTEKINSFKEKGAEYTKREIHEAILNQLF